MLSKILVDTKSCFNKRIHHVLEFVYWLQMVVVSYDMFKIGLTLKYFTYYKLYRYFLSLYFASIHSLPNI